MQSQQNILQAVRVLADNIILIVVTIEILTILQSKLEIQHVFEEPPHLP